MPRPAVAPFLFVGAPAERGCVEFVRAGLVVLVLSVAGPIALHSSANNGLATLAQLPSPLYVDPFLGCDAGQVGRTLLEPNDAITRFRSGITSKYLDIAPSARSVPFGMPGTVTNPKLRAVQAAVPVGAVGMLRWLLLFIKYDNSVYCDGIL